jgi:hypothetical protein
MPKEETVGCARPTGGMVGEEAPKEETQAVSQATEVKKMIQVGKKAPDFVAPCYYQGKFAMCLSA